MPNTEAGFGVSNGKQIKDLLAAIQHRTRRFVSDTDAGFGTSNGDLIKDYLEAIQYQIRRLIPDMDASFGALAMPSFSPTVQVAGTSSSGSVHNTYNFYRGVSVIARDGESAERIMRRLSNLQGIGVG